MKMEIDIEGMEPTLIGKRFNGIKMFSARAGIPKQGEVIEVGPVSSRYLCKAEEDFDQTLDGLRWIYKPVEPEGPEWVEFNIRSHFWKEYENWLWSMFDGSRLIASGQSALGFNGPAGDLIFDGYLHEDGVYYPSLIMFKNKNAYHRTPQGGVCQTTPVVAKSVRFRKVGT